MAFGLIMLRMSISLKSRKETILFHPGNAQLQTDDSDDNDLNCRNFEQQRAAKLAAFRLGDANRGVGSDGAQFFGFYDGVSDARYSDSR